MNQFWTLFWAVFLAEIVTMPIKKYFTPRYEKALAYIEQKILEKRIK